MMAVEWHGTKFYHISGSRPLLRDFNAAEWTRPLAMRQNRVLGDPMIGLMELLLIVFVAVVIYGYVRMAGRKNRKK
jgi:hypothetical protein